jgi:hypothetical protein
MAAPIDPTNIEAFLSIIVVLFKSIADSLVETEEVLATSADVTPPLSRVTRVHGALVDMNTVVAAALHDFRLAHVRTIVDEELGF